MNDFKGAVMFRPNDIGQLFGQDHLLDILINWVDHPDEMPQSILFSGPFGTGKTTVARMLANNIISLPDDLSEINAADARGIDEVRAWAESTRFSPFGSGGKVYIIDELHQMTTAAQSALLKVIEEPPKGVYFFLCTTEPLKLKDTIRSRCTRIETKLLKPEDTANLLSFVFGGKISPEIKEVIHKKSGGHARDAVKIGETAVLTGAVTAQDLQGEVGLGYGEIEEVLVEAFSPIAGNLHGEHYKQLAPQIANVQDGMALATVLDTVVDNAMLRGDTNIRKHYKEFLELRALRVDWKISSQQNALYFLSVVCS